MILSEVIPNERRHKTWLFVKITTEENVCCSKTKSGLRFVISGNEIFAKVCIRKNVIKLLKV